MVPKMSPVVIPEELIASEPEVEDLAIGDSLTETFAYTYVVGTQSSTSNLVITITKTRPKVKSLTTSLPELEKVLNRNT